MAYRNCCIEKLYKTIYEQKANNYSYLRCSCRETYYLLPYKIDDYSITIIREKDEDIYYFLDKEKELHPIFKLTDFEIKDKEARDLIIKSKILPILEEKINDDENIN